MPHCVVLEAGNLSRTLSDTIKLFLDASDGFVSHAFSLYIRFVTSSCIH
ncbi:hypothetical protein ACU8KH_05881 [Lachancea thermotolerans]